MDMKPVVPELAIAVLAVKDIQGTKKFYDAAFGWRIVVDDPVFVEYSVRDGFSVALASPSMHLDKYGKTPPEISADGVSSVELYLRVSDLDAVTEQVVSAGATILAPKKLYDWGEEAVYCRDPEGHVIVLASKPV
jgi:predicted enzyme related to lactoylglutathione lyase